MKRKYSDPLIFQAMMLSGSGIDIGENSGQVTDPDAPYPTPTPTPTPANGGGLNVNSMNVLQSTDEDLVIGESANTPPIVIDPIQAVPETKPESVIDVITGEETSSEAPVTTE